MIELSLFNIKRRFLNKATITLYVVVLVLMTLLCFADTAIKFLVPDFYNTNKLQLKGIEAKLFLKGYEDIFELDQDAELKIELNETGYRVSSSKSLSDAEKNYLEILIRQYDLLLHPVSQTPIEYKAQEDVVVNDDSFYVVITTLYFMVLSFSTLGSSEVVMEKSSHILETIAVIVGSKKHYLSKIVLGWSMVILQACYIMLVAFILLGVRQIYDEGSGLLDLAYRLGLLSQKYSSFMVLINDFVIDFAVFVNYLWSLIFLLLGVALIQVIMISISSRINSIEEAGALQGPLYIFFLLIYYLAILLNSPKHMNGGWGTLLSITPFTSMLLMPIRLIKYTVSGSELLLALLLSLAMMLILYYLGYQFYKASIFEYVPKKKHRFSPSRD